MTVDRSHDQEMSPTNKLSQTYTQICRGRGGTTDILAVQVQRIMMHNHATVHVIIEQRVFTACQHVK